MLGAITASVLLNADSAEGTVTSESPANTPAEENNSTAEAEDEDVDGEVLDTIDDIKFVKKVYKKDRGGKGVNLEGKAFASPRFASLSQAQNHIDTQLKLQQKHKSQNEKGGITAEDIILDNLHSMIDNKLRTRVKNEAQENYDKNKEWINSAPEVLFSPKDAFAWVPGIREPGQQNQVKILSAKLVELQKAGKTMADPEFVEVLMQLANTAVGGNK